MTESGTFERLSVFQNALLIFMIFRNRYSRALTVGMYANTTVISGVEPFQQNPVVTSRGATLTQLKSTSTGLFSLTGERREMELGVREGWGGGG